MYDEVAQVLHFTCPRWQTAILNRVAQLLRVLHTSLHPVTDTTIRVHDWYCRRRLPILHSVFCSTNPLVSACCRRRLHISCWVSATISRSASACCRRSLRISSSALHLTRRSALVYCRGRSSLSQLTVPCKYDAAMRQSIRVPSLPQHSKLL